MSLPDETRETFLRGNVRPVSVQSGPLKSGIFED
jgi:hypothetical protein